MVFGFILLLSQGSLEFVNCVHMFCGFFLDDSGFAAGWELGMPSWSLINIPGTIVDLSVNYCM